MGNRVKTDAQLEVGDIEIGAVEIKDATTSARAVVTASTPGGSDAGLVVRTPALPLPSGASTSAKQPALGTAGTPSTDVLSVQGISGGTALPTSLPSASTLTTAQVSVDTTAGGVLIAALNTSRKFLEITNTSTTVNIYIGNTGLTTSTGHAVPPGSSFRIDTTICTAAVYGIVAAASVTVTTMAW